MAVAVIVVLALAAGALTLLHTSQLPDGATAGTTDLPFQGPMLSLGPSEDLPQVGANGGPGPSAIEQWRSLAEQYAQVYGILAPEEILAIVWNESAGDPNSSNPSDPSYGLMGVELPIGKRYGNAADEGDLYDPETNIRSGAGFLADLKTKYEDQFPLTDPSNGWVQMYNTGEPKFLNQGVRNTSYQAKFLQHLSALGGQS